MSDTCLPPLLIERALLLVGAVHEHGPSDVDALLAGRSAVELRNLAVVLAAMVPDDQSPGDLLAWNDDRYEAPVQPMVTCGDTYEGTDTGYYRHLRTHGTLPCLACRSAHAEANRLREQRKRGVFL